MNSQSYILNKRVDFCLTNIISLLLLSTPLLGANEQKKLRPLDFVDSRLDALGVTSDLKGYLSNALNEPITQGQASGVTAALKNLFGETLDQVVDAQTQRTPLEWLALKLSEPEPNFNLESQDQFALKILHKSFHLLKPHEDIHMVQAVAIFASAWYPQSTRFLVKKTPLPVIPGMPIKIDLMARPNPYTNRYINPEITQILEIFHHRPRYQALFDRDSLFLKFVNYFWYQKTLEGLDSLVRIVHIDRLTARDPNQNNLLHLFTGQVHGSRGEDEAVLRILVLRPSLHRFTNIHGKTAFEQNFYSRLPLLLLTQPDIGLDHDHPLALSTVLNHFFYQSPRGNYVPIDDLTRPFAQWFNGPEIAPELIVRFAFSLFNALHILNLQNAQGLGEEEAIAFAQKIKAAWPRGIARHDSQFKDSLRSIRSPEILALFLRMHLRPTLNQLDQGHDYVLFQKEALDKILPAMGTNLKNSKTLASLEDYVDRRIKHEINLPEHTIQKIELHMSSKFLKLVRSQLDTRIFVAAAAMEAAQKEAAAHPSDPLYRARYQETIDAILNDHFPGEHRLYRMEQGLSYMTELSRILKKAKNSPVPGNQDLYSQLPRIKALTNAFLKVLYSVQQKHCQILGLEHSLRPQGSQASDLLLGISQLSGDTFGQLRHSLGIQSSGAADE